MDNQDLKYIKKHYGENFAKICRELFPSILETPGLLTKIITEKFDNVSTLYEDILSVKDEFKNYIYSFVDVEQNNKQIVQKSPEELLDKAGYKLYPECKTEKDIQRFKKYYKPGEELCTFRGGRLNSCRVWFAVKKNVDEIKRENFKSPTRQDEYGTSVISIQFTKGRNSTLSIKNRYNHTVNNPDNTFNNNLDNIISGLTSAFCKKYNINLINGYNGYFLPDGYVLGADGKLYKSNLEIDGCNYCANNVVVETNGNVIKYDKSKFTLIDNYLIDLENKKIAVFNTRFNSDSFTESIGDIQSINVTLDENKNRVINIIPKIGQTIQIVSNKLNQIIKYANTNVEEIEDSFLHYNENLTELNLPNLKQIGYQFLYRNKDLKKLNLPNVKEIGNDFLFNNENLTELNLPNLKQIGDNFLLSNECLKRLNLPNVKEIGDCFLYYNENLTELNLPNVTKIGDKFLYYNENLTELNLPNVKEIGDEFLILNRWLKRLNLPNVTKIGDKFLLNNECLKRLNLPNATKIGDNFLDDNENLTELNLPNIKEIGDDFLHCNEDLKELNLPKVEKIGKHFLYHNECIEEINLPEVKEIGGKFLYSNEKLTELNLPNVTKIGDKFLYYNENLTELNLPNIKEIGDDFLFHNECIEEINLPNVKEIGNDFLFLNINFKKQNFLQLKNDDKDLLL